jgi:AAA+ ATPase superfamily predicted ATPase
MAILNPFPTIEYISPDYFCDREEEQKQIVESIENQRNLTIVSRRRLGKTALIKHCFYLLKDRKDLSLHYFDIYATQSLSEFINLFSVSLLGYFESKPDRLLNKITKVLGRFRPKLTFDELSGAPSVELTLQSENDTRQSLNAIFEYLSEQKQRIIIAIDEFQQIINYPEKNVEALLRTHIQNCRNVTMIFSGSNRRMITSIFSDYARPFYQSTGFLFLEIIDSQRYAEFIKHHFRKEDRIISDDAVRYIFEWTFGYTYFVQEICNRLFATGIPVISLEDCKKAADTILKERDQLYAMYRNILTKSQFKLLRAIASETGVKQPNASGFIQQHKLVAPSTVNRALAALEESDLIAFDNDEYSVHDIFLMRWLQNLH